MLLVWAEPSFEFRYLENMFQRDASVELKTVLQNGDLEHAEQNVSALKGFPVRRDDLFQCDVIVLGDVNPAGLTAADMQHVAEFVDQPGKGGTLICVAGPNYMPLAFRETPLARLMPFDLGTARCRTPTKRSRKVSPYSRPTSVWPRRVCNWETHRPTRRPSGKACPRSIGCSKPRI